MDNNFIEFRRMGGSRIRVSADSLVAIVEVEHTVNKEKYAGVRVYLGPQAFFDLEEETLETVWNKFCQARQRQVSVIVAPSADYAGFDDFDMQIVRHLAPLAEEDMIEEGRFVVGAQGQKIRVPS